MPFADWNEPSVGTLPGKAEEKASLATFDQIAGNDLLRKFVKLLVVPEPSLRWTTLIGRSGNVIVSPSFTVSMGDAVK